MDWWIKLINDCGVVSQIDVTSAADINCISHTNSRHQLVFTFEAHDVTVLSADILHTAPILGKLEYSMDNSRQYLLIALIITTETQLYVAPVVAALQRAPRRGKT